MKISNVKARSHCKWHQAYKIYNLSQIKNALIWNKLKLNVNEC